MKPVWFLVFVAVAAVVFATVIIRFFNTVPQRSIVHAVIFSLYVICGVALAFVPFDRKHRRSRWAKGLFVMAALILVFVGVAKLLLHYTIWVLSPTHEHAFSDTLEGLLGIAMGLLLALLFSGELAGRSVSQNDQA